VQYDAAQTQRFYKLLTERLRGEAGVRSVGLTQNPPLGLDGFERVEFVPEGVTMPPGRETYGSLMDTVDEGYFATMGIPILRGRNFHTSDNAEAPRVAVVNELFARRYWPKGDALGQRFRLGGATGPAVEVVGIAPKVKYVDSFDRGADFVYFPLAQRPVARLAVLIRAEGDPLSLVGVAKDAVRTLDPNMPMLQTMSYGELFRYATVVGPGVAIKLVGTLGSIALLLAIAGLYGMVAYNVSRRTREIGIRMAIGARPGDVLRLMIGKGMTLVAVGAVLGLAMSFGVERMMNSMLFNTGGVDLLVYVVVVPAMIAATLLAAYVPARRAARIAPTVALRYE
jgi:predicted permease